MAARDDETFVREILVDRIGAAHVAVGFDFRFGRGRAGDAERLAALGARHGFTVTVVDAVDDARHAGKVSSSDIRAAVQAGDMADAANLLSRPWAIEGAVADGFRRGRTIGFPTANVGLADYVRPRFGVYATRTNVGDGAWRAGVSNVGMKPTVGGVSEPLAETHVFDWSGDLYGRPVETQLLHFLRPEQKFESFEALTAQIAQDADAARKALA
jgi:riboflavin kinase/FMN adenylyltransferase